LNIRRKLVLAAAILATIVVFAGCSTGDTTSKGSNAPHKITKIGLMVQDMSNPFFSAMDKAAKQEAARIGATVNTQDAHLDLSNQDNEIDAFVQQGVQLIVVSAVDGNGIGPAIQRAKQAGITVVAVDTPAATADATVRTNAVQAAEQSCQYLMDQIGGKGDILIVDGTPIQTITDRINGCKTVVAKYPNVHIVGQQRTQNDRASGLSVTTDMLTAHPEVAGIFGMNDPTALGAVLAVEQAGLTKQVKVTSVDGSPEGVAELKRPDSPFVGFANQNPGEMVRQAIQLGQQIAAAKPPAQKEILIPSQLYTRQNINTYPGW
jgi:ribose transport system substrate-binding protein